jgi:hypothetical protein
MAADDPVSAALAQAREAIAAMFREFGTLPLDEARASFAAGTLTRTAERLADALDAALALHAPREAVLPGTACFAHQTARDTMVPVPGCKACTQDKTREACPECRDGWGDPVPIAGCRVRKAVLAALGGEGQAGG